MIPTAVCLFLTGALFGIYMFTRHLRRRVIPAWAAVLHGAFGATAFGVVVLLLARAPGMALVREALVILIAAIVLGVVNLLFHVRRVRHRTMLIVMHAIAAVGGVGTLAYAGFVAASQPGSPSPSQPGGPADGYGAPVAMGATLTSATTTATTPVPRETASAAAATAPLAATAPSAPKFPPGPAWTDRPLNFDSASAMLDPQAQGNLADVASTLQSHPEITLIEVQGHTDERGDAAGNAKLARARAAAVVDFLVAKGVARSRLRAVGYGALCPADASCQGPNAPASCHQPSSWQEDRRVRLLVLEAGGERFHGKVTCDAGMSATPRDDQRYASP